MKEEIGKVKRGQRMGDFECLSSACKSDVVEAVEGTCFMIRKYEVDGSSSPVGRELREKIGTWTDEGQAGHRIFFVI